MQYTHTRARGERAVLIRSPLLNGDWRRDRPPRRRTPACGRAEQVIPPRHVDVQNEFSRYILDNKCLKLPTLFQEFPYFFKREIDHNSFFCFYVASVAVRCTGSL